jgi:membrane protease YdiL (CAAX protease family)
VLGWLLALLLVGVLALSNHQPALEPQEGDAQATIEEAEQVGPGALFEISAKYTVFAGRMTGTSDALRSEAVTSLEPLVSGPADDVRLAIVDGELLGADAATERMEAIEEREPSEAIKSDLYALHLIYAEDQPLSESARERLVERHGWFGRLAASFGESDEAPDRARVLAEADRIGTLFLAGLGLVIVLGVAGLALFIVALTLIATARLRTRFVAPEPGGSAGIETFSIFLGAHWMLSIASGLIIATIGERFLPAVQMLLWVLLAVPLWPLVRGGTFAEVKQSLGWHRGEGVFKEVGAGVVGYLAGLPVMGLGILIVLALMAISKLIMHEAPAPPSHPLPDELAAGGIGTAILLFVLATMWAPLVEESIFRGALYSQLRGRLGAVLSGAISGFIFAAIHPQGWMAIPALMALGFNFAMLREWRGSLIAPITAHALNNGMVVTALLILFGA